MSIDQPLETEISVAQHTTGINSVAERKAKRVLERVSRGETLANAAKNEHLTVGAISDPDNPIRQSIQSLIGGYFLPPEARKQMVRAGLNKVFLTNVASEDPAAQKLALDAAKQIAADPEVGLTQEVSGGVTINIGELAGVFEQIRASKAPEVSDGRPRDDRGEEITDADFEDVGS